MFVQERHNQILKQLNQKGSVKVKELSHQYQVSEDCIRKDLSVLEKKGLLKKTYGGAVQVRLNPHLYKSEDRKKTPNDERVVIAKKALDLIQDGDVLFLDMSLSNVELAKMLTDSYLKITVITNMIDILNILRHSQVSVIFIGGQLNHEKDGFWGSLSIQMMDSFQIDKAFLGVVGVDMFTQHLSTYHIDDGMMKSKVIKQSQYSYILCEQRKFQEDGHYIYASLDDIQGIIVASKEHIDVQNENIMII